jgi:hypothetical protein
MVVVTELAIKAKRYAITPGYEASSMIGLAIEQSSKGGSLITDAYRRCDWMRVRPPITSDSLGGSK